MVETIAKNILANPKRVQKLKNLVRGDMRDKAKQFVIGEAASLHAKLTDAEVMKAAAMVANQV